jgi:hypothetical protein
MIDGIKIKFIREIKTLFQIELNHFGSECIVFENQTVKVTGNVESLAITYDENFPLLWVTNGIILRRRR